ncbi:S10 family serine carboxypeptidase-like protein [Sphingopyxis terrae]|uniref:S10 family serine carboxypeptidase-like protein n=1 Tax=Sphingopyxis terrae TaxID=33052 RepID=UPI002A17E435|nr:hypothetical protein [Sphingopyxis terrae]MDX8356504.1 hypothetical protein [Sphingopyxis terrae]
MTLKAAILAAVLAAFLPGCAGAQTTADREAVSESNWPRVTVLADLGPRQFAKEAHGTFGGRKMRYRATLSEMIVKDRNGRPASSLFITSFVETAAAPRKRPVIFLFNGGPGAAANTLMFGAFGPQRLERFDSSAQADPATPLVPNGDSVLDVADLVFIDAPETGYGQPLPGTDPRTFRSSDGDSSAFTQIILRWLTDQRRLGDDVYVAGESYGTLRAVSLARDLAAAAPRVDISGIIMISQAITYNGPASLGVRNLPNPVTAATRLQDIAALAWYHGLLDNRRISLGQAIEAARSFALHEYAPALLEGNRLAAAERIRIADGLATVTGVPARTWLDGNLHLDHPRRQMLKDRGLALAQFDGRETEALANIPRDEDRDWTAAVRGLSSASERFNFEMFGQDLGEYRTLVPDPYGFELTWTYIQPPAPGLDIVLKEQMQANPKLRLMVTQGVFDTSSSMGATDYLFSQLGASPERATMVLYGGGHMLYSDREGREAFTADVRAFVTGRTLVSRGYPTVAPAAR